MENNNLNTGKIDYITSQFKKTFGKKYENYCITRIYSLLNRNDLKIVTQQLFKRKGKKIALADLYLPQVNVWVEIDEGHHFDQADLDIKRTNEVLEENKLSDEVKRKYDALNEVINVGLEEPYRIIVFNKSLEEINNQIDYIVCEINNRIKKMGNNFIPWDNINNSSKDFIERGSINVSDNAKFRTINDVGKIFNIDKVAFNQKIHGYVHIKDNLYYWCPIVKIKGDECDNNSWENEISDDGLFLFENQKERKSDYLSRAINENHVRYVFIKYKDESEKIIYKFKGVFKLDLEQSKAKNIRVWKRTSDNVDLKNFFKGEA